MNSFFLDIRICIVGDFTCDDDTRADDTQRPLQSAVSLARVGLYGKACRVLQSSGIAPDNNNTWHLLQAKHPSCPLPTVPDIPTISLLFSPDFDILSMLRSISFPKGTAAGPSGLRVQHLLDAASIPLQTSICSSLRDIWHQVKLPRQCLNS